MLNIIGGLAGVYLIGALAVAVVTMYESPTPPDSSDVVKRAFAWPYDAFMLAKAWIVSFKKP